MVSRCWVVTRFVNYFFVCCNCNYGCTNISCWILHKSRKECFRNTANDSERVWQFRAQSIQRLPTPEEAVIPPPPPTKTSKVFLGLLIDDRPVSVRKTAECLNISHSTFCTIVEQYFGKICINIVPASSTMKQKHKRIAFCHDFFSWQRMGLKNRYRWEVVVLRVLSWNKASE